MVRLTIICTQSRETKYDEADQNEGIGDSCQNADCWERGWEKNMVHNHVHNYTWKNGSIPQYARRSKPITRLFKRTAIMHI